MSALEKVAEMKHAAVETTKSSMSKALYLASAVESIWLKKASGRHDCSGRLCCKTAPTCEVEASVMREISSAEEGWSSSAAAESAALTGSKADSMLGIDEKGYIWAKVLSSSFWSCFFPPF
jgi:hypothetical protein